MKLSQDYDIHEDGYFLGESPAVKALIHKVNGVAKSNSRILIKGQLGTGKQNLAKLIHCKSGRADKEFIYINCSSLKDSELDAQLFGSDVEEGYIKKSNVGTLYLHNINDMPIEIQRKLLAYLSKENCLEEDEKDESCRLITSTARDIENLIKKEKFLQDLFYRLNVVCIEIPSLEERVEDIKYLCDFFIQKSVDVNGLSNKHFSEEAIIILQNSSWPANVTQLRSFCNTVLIANSGVRKKEITKEMMPMYIASEDASSNSSSADALLSKSLAEAKKVFEKEYLTGQLERFSWNVSKTARFAQIERSYLHKKINSLGIKRKK